MKIVIIGAGEVGFHIASRLALENKDVVVVDQNPEVLKRIRETIDAQTFTLYTKIEKFGLKIETSVSNLSSKKETAWTYADSNPYFPYLTAS